MPIRLALSPWLLTGLLCAPVLVYLAERLFDNSPLRLALWLTAGGLWLTAIIGHGVACLRRPEFRALLVRLLAAEGGVGLASALWLCSRWTYVNRAEELATGLLVTALILVTLAMGAIIALALSTRSVRQCDVVEARRVDQALGAGLLVSLGITSLALLNFAAQRNDLRIDLAHEAPASPSDSTLSLIHNSQQALEVMLFFENQSPVLGQIQDYFDALQAHGVTVRQADQELAFDLAKSLKVHRNGTITLIAGERHESWHIGEDYANARQRLRELDNALRERLTQLSRGLRTVYFTHEHGEKPDRKTADDSSDAAATFGQLVRSLNNKVLYLSPARLGREVPGDADLVVIHGPRQGFLEQEVASLRRYAASGGALLLLLDPSEDPGLAALLAELGLTRGRDVLAHEREYFRDTQTPADRAFLFATNFTRHPATQTLSDVRRRAAVMFRRVGSLSRVPDSDAKVVMLVQSRARTFTERNGNWTYDPDTERQGIFDLAAAVTLPGSGSRPGRSLVIADSDVFDDRLMTSEPNLQFALDSLLWLLRDDTGGGAVDTGRAVPLRHTRDSDLLWFYGSTFAVPGLILLLGFGVTRRLHARGRQ